MERMIAGQPYPALLAVLLCPKNVPIHIRHCVIYIYVCGNLSWFHSDNLWAKGSVVHFKKLTN
jgi:hypothetical protein